DALLVRARVGVIVDAVLVRVLGAPVLGRVRAPLTGGARTGVLHVEHTVLVPIRGRTAILRWIGLELSRGVGASVDIIADTVVVPVPDHLGPGLLLGPGRGQGRPADHGHHADARRADGVERPRPGGGAEDQIPERADLGAEQDLHAGRVRGLDV